MSQERFVSTLGVRVYGLAAILLGVLGLVWGGFATDWQRVPVGIPHHLALARAAAIYELLAGAAMLWRPTRRAAALLLAAVYTIFVLLWVARVVAAPMVYDNWSNVFEEFSLVVAGAVAFASAAPSGTAWARCAGAISRVYGICVASFGLDHLFYMSAAAILVPRWMPPGQMFWALAVAICFFLAAGAILSGVLAALATRLLTAMIVGFGLLVWLPRLVAQPRAHFIWSANAVNLALLGAAWVVADSFAMRRRERASGVGEAVEMSAEAHA